MKRLQARRRFAARTICLAVAAVFAEAAIAQSPPPQTLPTGGVVASGAATVGAATTSPAGVAQMTVTQTSQRALIDWVTFNLGSNAALTFNQTAGNASITANRVPASAGKSVIEGLLSANGNVMILNPNGVLFGATARVNVAGLVASSGNVSDASLSDTATGPIAITGATTGSIRNEGIITVAGSGLVAFVAPSVSNSGTITATAGRIVLASAQAATISLNGGLYEIAINQGVAGGSIANTGTLSASDGTIILSALDAANAVSGLINLEGIQQANRIEVNGGHVVLKSDLNAAIVTGNSNSVEVHNGAHIQDAVDIVKTGGTIDVWGGSYTEGHANVDYFGAPGGGQFFGLHVYKDNLSINGLNASGGALTGLDDPQMPVVTAQYQTGFGAQHFISGSGVTIDGMKFKPVATGDNKTFEVIGNNFTLRNSVIDNSGNGTSAAFYISDFSVPGDPFALLGKPDVETFHLLNNRFIAGTAPGALVVIASGTGNSTAASNRVFSGNELIGNPAVAGARGFQIQGQLPNIPWQTLTAGAVTVNNNTFSGFAAPVRTVGILTQQLDWNSVFNGNTFVGGAALAFAGDSTTARVGSVSVIPQDGTTTPHDAPDTRITRDIQSSIDRAQAGDSVRALAGTYAESLSISKALTLTGAGKGVTVIDPVGSSTDGIVVQGNIGADATVAITDLTVQGGKNGIRVADGTTLGTITLDRLVVRDNASNGFISNNGGSNATSVANINILNSVFAGNGVGGGSADVNLFLFNGNALISNVDILGTRSAASNFSGATDYGLQIRGYGDLASVSPAGHVTLDNVRIAGNYRRAHLGIQRYSDAGNIVMNDVVLGGARSASTGDGTASVAASNAGWATFFSSDMRGAVSLGDTLFAGGSFGFGDIFIGDGTAGLRVDATQAEFSGITRTHTAAGADNFAIEDRVVHALDNASIGGLVTWQANNLYVTQSSGSIQRGINAACTCDTVHVGAGTFAEQLTITKSLSLVGAGADSTTISPTSLTADASGMRNILTIGGGPANNAEVSGFTFKGPVPEITAGIFVRDGAHAHIHDNKLIDMRESAALSGNQRGVGIFVGRALLSTSGTAVIENNVITGYQKGGIVVDGPGSQATITGNTVTGSGPTGVIAQNGIQVSRGANATVTGNTVRNNVYTGSHADPDDFASGILFFTSDPYVGQGGITIGSNNTITANEFGIWTNDPGTLATISVTGASGNTRNAVAYFSGGYAGQGPLLQYPAWSATNAALVNATAFGGTPHSGDIVDVGGALRVYGWNGFTAIQPAINAVAAGGTVNVDAGTFAEHVVVNQQRNLLFSGSTIHDLTINSGAAGSGIGGSVTADAVTGFVFNAPVVLLRDTVLDTSAAGGAVSAVAINGSSAGGQAFTVRAGSGTVNLGNLGAATRLGATDVSGIINFTGSSYFADSLRFAGAMALSQPTTTFTTNGGSIRLEGDIQNADSSAHALSLTAGMGDITMVSGGMESNPLGQFESASNNFSLSGTLWVTGFNIQAAGNVALSDHSVHTTQPGTFNIITAGGNSTGSVFSEGALFVGVTGDVKMTIAAPSAVVQAGGDAEVTNGGNGMIEVNGKPQVPAKVSTRVDNSRMLPSENVIVANVAGSAAGSAGDSAGEAQKTASGRTRVVVDVPARAGALLDRGLGVEIDLTPRN